MRCVALAVVAISMISGCGGQSPDYASLNLVEVWGTVTLDGERVGAAVLFEADDQTFSYAETNSRGEYALQFNSEISGVMPGPRTVRITSVGLSFEDSGADEEESEDVDQPAREPERVPSRYNSASTLTVTVSESERQFDFDLTSD
jgi:hypothetical protein